MKEKNAFFTVCNIQYLPKAIVLAKSLYDIQGEKLIIYIFDKIINDIPLSDTYELNWISEQEVPCYNQVAFMYDVTESCTSVKPFLTIQLLSRYRNVIYLDPDIYIFSNLSEISLLLENYPIILTPHYVTPIDDPKLDYDIGLMRFGSFNLGFYAVNDSEESFKFLNWWSIRCLNLGFAESQFGLSVDQKWVSIAPCFFENIKIIFDLGYNMAFWNLHERYLNVVDNKYFVNHQYELKFFHFSSFDVERPTTISTRPHNWSKDGREDLNQICIQYAKMIKEHDFGLTKIKYSYDYMSDGTYISPVARRAYASVLNEISIEHDPFNSNGIIGEFLRKNHLLVSNNKSYKPLFESNLSGYNWQFKLVNSMLRLILKFVGPNMFTNYSRLLVYLSSYRKNRNLWKL